MHLNEKYLQNAHNMEKRHKIFRSHYYDSHRII